MDGVWQLEAGQVLGILRLLAQALDVSLEIHDRVRAKISKMKRGVPEGSAEWDALYSQFLREEMEKIRKVR